MSLNRVLITIMLLVNFSSCFTQSKVRNKTFGVMLKGMLSHTVNEITINEFENSDSIILLDAREPREFEVSHIQGAKFVGYDNCDLSLLDSIPKDREIIVYCSIGYRSEKIAEEVKKMGFSKVSNLYGGIFEWKNEGGQVYNKDGLTEDIHAFGRTWGIWLNKGNKVYK